MKVSLMAVLAAATLAAGAPSAQAVLLMPTTAIISPVQPTAIVVEGVLARATDGDLATGYDVAVSMADFGASGFIAEFLFDVSGFSSISSVTARLDVVADFGPITVFNFISWGGNQFTLGNVNVPAPSGQLVTATVFPVPGGSQPNRLEDFISGSTLKLVFMTGVAASAQDATISASFREITVDVQGTQVPSAGALPLFASMLALGALTLRRHRRG